MNKYLFLAEPSVELRIAYNDMLDEWEETGERIIPWVLRLERADFGKLVENLKKLQLGVKLDANAVPCSTYWLMDTNDKMYGAVNIRHMLNEELLNTGGHIGYGIRPSERGKGYATELLRLALIEIKKIGVDRVCLTCDHDNLASEHVIIRNGGLFDRMFMYDGILTKRFWIDL